MSALLVSLLIAAIVLIQCVIGGTRLVFSLPTYALLAAAGVLSVFALRRSKATPGLVCLVVTALFFTYILVRAAWSPIDYQWWQDFYMVLGCLVVYLLTAFYVMTPRARNAVVITLLVLALIETFVALRQFSRGDQWMPFGFIRGAIVARGGEGYGRRASGMFISPIHLAGYLEMVAAFGLSFAFWSPWKVWARLVAGYLALVCFLGIAITGSRGGYLSSAFSLFVFTLLSLYVYRRARPQRFGRVLLIVTVCLGLGLVGGTWLMSQNQLLRQRLSMISQQLNEKNRDVRIYNWQAALDQFRVDPIFGTGAGTHLYYGRLFRRPAIQAEPIHAHSDYLELLAEYGVIGGVGMAVFLFVHLWRGARACGATLRRDPHSEADYESLGHDVLAQQIGALTAVSALLVHSVSDFNMHVPGNALTMAFIFGLLANPALAPASGTLAAVSRAFRYALPALGVYICVVALPKFTGEYWCEKGRVALRQRNLAAAIEYSALALQYEQRNPNIFFHLGGAYRGTALASSEPDVKKQNLEFALAAYAGGLSIFPGDEHMLIRTGQVFEALGRFPEAEKAYTTAIAHDPKLGATHAYYARYLASIGRQLEAEKRLEIARGFAGSAVDAVVRGSSLDLQAIQE